MSKSRVLLGLLAVAGVVVIGRGFLASPSDEGEQKDLINRVWLDAWPSSETDMREAFVVLNPPRQPLARVGSFMRTSRWRGAFEAFQYKSPRDGRMQLRYPQDGKTEEVRFRVSRCHGEGFNRCLDIEGNTRGVHRYRSSDDLVIRVDSADRADDGSSAISGDSSALWGRVEAAARASGALSR